MKNLREIIKKLHPNLCTPYIISPWKQEVLQSINAVIEKESNDHQHK